MPVSLSDVDEQLAHLGEVPVSLSELVERHGGAGLSLAAADDALTSLHDGERSEAPFASTPGRAVLTKTLPGSVAAAFEPTMPGTFSELPPAPTSAAPAASEEELTHEDMDAIVDASLPPMAPDDFDVPEVPDLRRHSSFPARASRQRHDTMRDSPTGQLPVVAVDSDMDAPVSLPSREDSATAAPASAFAADVALDSEPEPQTDATASAVEAMFEDLERPPAAEGTTTGVFAGGMTSPPSRVSVSVPPPFRAGSADAASSKTARADETGDFELLFDEEFEEIDDGDVELLE